MIKKIRILVLILCFFAIAYFSLSYSGRFNNFVFSNLINPYDPLKVPLSRPVKKQLQQGEAWEDPRGLFPIFAYNVPDGTNNLSASLKIIERGGINIIVNGNLGWMPDPYKLKQAFERLEDSDLQWLAIIENECKDNFIYNNSNDETNFQIKDYLKSFNENYVYGWKVWDEPGINRKLCTPFNLSPNDDNADINSMIKQIRSDSLLNKKLDFINLYPTYWDGTPTAEDYEKYVDAFFASQEYKPRVLCFDHYPLLKTEAGGFRKDYYLNLEIIRNKSLQYSVPFWMIVLSSGHLSYKNPTFEEISFQVYSALAYGVKGIGYYLYSKSGEQVGYTSWILEDYVDNLNVPDSLHGPLFYPVKELNQNIQRIGKVLSKLKSVDVIHTSNYPNKQLDIDESIFTPHKTNSLIKEIVNTDNVNVIPNILIGVFSDDKSINITGKYFLIVNKDVTTSSNITIKLNGLHKIFHYDKKTGENFFISAKNNINLMIQPGSGQLLFIE